MNLKTNPNLDGEEFFAQLKFFINKKEDNIFVNFFFFWSSISLLA